MFPFCSKNGFSNFYRKESFRENLPKNSNTLDSLINLIKEESSYFIEENPNEVEDYHENLQPYKYINGYTIIYDKNSEGIKVKKSQSSKNFSIKYPHQDNNKSQILYHNQGHGLVTNEQIEAARLERRRRILHDEHKARKNKFEDNRAKPDPPRREVREKENTYQNTYTKIERI